MKCEVTTERNEVVGRSHSFGGTEALCETFCAFAPLRRCVTELLETGTERRSEERDGLDEAQGSAIDLLLCR